MLQRCLIFDLDGTLLDSRESILMSMEFALKKIGRTEAVDEKQALRQDLLSTLRDTAQAHGTRFSDEERYRFIQNYRAHQRETAFQVIRTYQGVADTLSELKKKFSLGLATTKTTDQANHILQIFRLDSFFDHIQGTDKGLRHKPAPDILFRTHTYLGAKSRALYVGDSPNDILAAKNAHMFSMAALYGFSEREDLESYEPDWMLHRFEDILEIEEDLLSPLAPPLSPQAVLRREVQIQ